jgi:hypothetical protein
MPSFWPSDPLPLQGDYKIWLVSSTIRLRPMLNSWTVQEVVIEVVFLVYTGCG